MRIRKHFCFDIPLTRTAIDLSRPRGERIEHIGDLTIIGDGYKDTLQDDPRKAFSFELSYVGLRGNDILPELQADIMHDLLSTVYDATEKHLQYLFEKQEEPLERKPDSLFEQVANLCRITNHINYGTPL